MSEYDEAFATTTEQPALDVVGHAERYVIGALLKDLTVLRPVQEEVVPRDFADLRLADIYSGIVRMAAEKEPVTYITVADQLHAWDVRGIDLTDLARWVDEVTTADAAPYYAKKVREAGIRRSVTKVGDDLRAAADPGVAIAAAQAALRDIVDRDGSSVEGVRWLSEVLEVPEDADTYDWVIPDFIERKDRLMLSAAEGTGKSMLLRQMALLAAGGIHPFRFTHMEPIRALVVDAENSERQWRRSVRPMAEEVTLRGRRDPRPHLALECTPVMDITKPESLGKLHRWIDEAKPDLLVLGPLYRMTKGSLNNDDDVEPVLNALDSLRERDVAMLIEVHAGHARSSSGERELRPRGSSALLGWPEFGLGLRRDRVIEGRHPTFSLVRWRGDRDRREWPQKFMRGRVWPWEPTY